MLEADLKIYLFINTTGGFIIIKILLWTSLQNKCLKSHNFIVLYCLIANNAMNIEGKKNNNKYHERCYAAGL